MSTDKEVLKDYYGKRVGKIEGKIAENDVWLVFRVSIYSKAVRDKMPPSESMRSGAAVLC